MIKSYNKKVLLLCIILGIMLMTLFVACSYIIEEEEPPKRQSWIIQTVDNTVVLLNNGEIVEVFGDISVDNLPISDKENLKSGISFVSKADALMALEDYDG